MSRRPASPDDGAVATIIETAAYRELIDRLKQRVRESQAHAARTVNAELVMLYWAIGREILVQQQANGWGDGVVERISQDLTAEVGGGRGFSRRSLFYMRRFATLWPDREKVPPLVAQIGWSLHRVLLDPFGDQPDLYLWYAAKAAENRWSRRYLEAQVSLRLHVREGAALTNFASALEPDDAEHGLAAMKDPYVLDFLDLLFYHHTLRRFVVIDLKIGTFKVEHVGKMNFYLNAVDQQLRHDDDRESHLDEIRAQLTDRVARHLPADA